MKENLAQYLKPVLGFIILGFMVWYFSDIVAYVLVSIFLSLLGMPLVKRLPLSSLSIKYPAISLLTIFNSSRTILLERIRT